MHDKLLKGGGARVADVVLVQLRKGIQKVLLLSVRATCREHLQRIEALRLASQAVWGPGAFFSCAAQLQHSELRNAALTHADH